MAKKRDVNSHPEPVGGSSPGRNERQILIRQDVVALQRPDIARNPQQALAHRCRNKAT